MIANSTFSENSETNGSGILNEHSGSIITLTNSIIANSLTGFDCYNSGSTIIDGGFNLIEDGSCGFDVGGDPMLRPLQDNGGETYTHALLALSPALDAGNCPDSSRDQRGSPRPVDISNIPNVTDACDIGAFEGQHDEIQLNVVYMPIVLKPIP